jgi:hypothetical protein
MNEQSADSRRERPFVFIASLRRTGSTVLSEALTELPYSFIFREPRLDMNWFNLKPSDAAQLKELGIDLVAFARKHRLAAFFSRRLGVGETYMVKAQNPCAAGWYQRDTARELEAVSCPFPSHEDLAYRARPARHLHIIVLQSYQRTGELVGTLHA